MTQIVFFAPDMSEIAQRRRIEGWRAAGFEVSSLSFAKADGPLQTAPDWPDTRLGTIRQRHLIRRLGTVLAAMIRIRSSRDMIKAADVLIARNIDMLLLALFARFWLGARAPVIYECLDIHGIFTGKGIISWLCRRIERLALRKIDLLILSSPGFYHHYFAVIQSYHGPWVLLENKLWFGQARLRRPDNLRAVTGPLVLGWVGALRCQESFDILRKVAMLLGDMIRIECHGIVHDHALPDFHKQLEKLTNMTYHGAYGYPFGLAAVYARLDLVWAQDLWQGAANSKWLLPNRLYEAGWCCCPAVAVAGTETAAKIQQFGSGYVIEHADFSALAELLRGLSPQDITDLRNRLRALPERMFRLDAGEYCQIAHSLLQAIEVSDDYLTKRS